MDGLWVLVWLAVAVLSFVQVAGTLYTIHHRRRLGSSAPVALLWGLLGFAIVPLAALFLTGLLGEFATNWISNQKTLSWLTVAIFPTSIVMMWAYQLSYWHLTRHAATHQTATI